jgi:hypothetical protein
MNNEGNNEINLAMVHSFITKQAAKRFVEDTSKGVKLLVRIWKKRAQSLKK